MRLAGTTSVDACSQNEISKRATSVMMLGFGRAVGMPPGLATVGRVVESRYRAEGRLVTLRRRAFITSDLRLHEPGFLYVGRRVFGSALPIGAGCRRLYFSDWLPMALGATRSPTLFRVRAFNDA